MKRWLVAFIVMALFLVGVAMADNWGQGDLYDISWYVDHESDTEYEITSALQYGGLIALVNNEANVKALGYNSTINFQGKVIHITQDIDLSSNYARPIADLTTKAFRGTLDGLKADGTCAVITGLKTDSAYAGMFGCVNGATIKNLILNNGSHSGNYYIGSIVGLAQGGTVIENISCVSVSIKSKYYYAGGIAGVGHNSTIKNCSFDGTVTGNYSGGITGTGDTATISECYFQGTISGTYSGGISGAAYEAIITECLVGDTTNTTSVSGTYTGGIAGLSNYESAYSDCSVVNVINSGSYAGGAIGQDTNSTLSQIVISNNSISGSNRAGGIIGYASNTVIDETTISNSTIKSTNYSGGYAGGIIGYGYGTVTNCITSNDTVIIGNTAGGIFGAAATNFITIESCTNNAEIGPYNYYGSSFGGLIGNLSSNLKEVTITNSTNHGKLIKNGSEVWFDHVGGLVGIASNFSSLKIINCENTGEFQIRGEHIGGAIGSIINNNSSGSIDVSVSSFKNGSEISGDYTGGVVGYARQYSDSSINFKFKNCSNMASISGNEYAGGITGYLGYTIVDLLGGDVGLIGYTGMTANFTDCWNEGKITGKIVGGITSEIFHGAITHCLNMGAVSCIGSTSENNRYAGGLIGVNDRGDIINSANYGTVTGNTGTNATGGLVGYNFTSFLRNSYNKADISDGYYSGGVSGVFGKDFAGEYYPLQYSNITNAYSSGTITGSDPAGITHTWHENFDTGYWVKSNANKGLGVYDGKVYQNPEHTVAGYVNSVDDKVTTVTYNASFTEQNPTETSMTLLQTLEYEVQDYNAASPEISYLHWVQPQSNPSPYGASYDGNLYPVFGYPITFVIYTDGEVSSIGGSLDSTDATQIEDFFNGGYLQDYYGANGDAINYTAKANKGYAFEKSESDDVTLTGDAADITNGFTMRALNTDEDPVVINLYFVSQYTAQITKIWDDADDEDRIRPSELSVSLALNNAVIQDINENNVEEIITPDENGYWQSEIYTLPNNENYADLEIWEGHIDDYTVEKRSITIDGHDIYAVIINRHEPAPKVVFTATNESMVDVDYKVTKTWKDDAALTSITHPDILVQLYQGEEPNLELVAEKILTSGLESVTFNDMPKYTNNDGETLVKYTIKEVINDDKWVNIGNVWYNMNGLGTYTATVTNATITTDTVHDSEVSGTIVNEYDLLQKTIDVEITKVWNDHQNENKVRPESIKLGLFRYATDTAPVAEITLSKDSDDIDNDAASWTGKFKDLPLYEDTEFIDYTKYVIKEWDPASNKWMFYGDSMIVTSGELDYTYTYQKVAE